MSFNSTEPKCQGSDLHVALLVRGCKRVSALVMRKIGRCSCGLSVKQVPSISQEVGGWIVTSISHHYGSEDEGVESPVCRTEVSRCESGQARHFCHEISIGARFPQNPSGSNGIVPVRGLLAGNPFDGPLVEDYLGSTPIEATYGLECPVVGRLLRQVQNTSASPCPSVFRSVAQLVEHAVWDREVVGSCPTIPTIFLCVNDGFNSHRLAGGCLRVENYLHAQQCRCNIAMESLKIVSSRKATGLSGPSYQSWRPSMIVNWPINRM